MCTVSDARLETNLRGANPAAEAFRADAVVSIRPWYLPVKVAVEFALALILLVATSPLLLLAMLLVRLTSRGPALYSQIRVGRGGRPFTIYKIRTMYHQCESWTGARWSLPGDSRVTPVGRWLRRTHLDELPQLLNVLQGEMALLGPRPERPEFVPQLEMAIPLYRARLQVRPGLTGLAQIQLPPDTDLESVLLKLAFDLYYVENLSLWLDLRIFLGTVLYMAGLPFHWIRSLLGLPRKSSAERGYHNLVHRCRPVPLSSNGKGNGVHVGEAPVPQLQGESIVQRDNGMRSMPAEPRPT